jgi:glycosyltransferase involved in cell wall biosynthesis
MSIIKPNVSIILNCYNGEKYLAEAIKSIKKQTYKNFEVIFWDNKSTDKSKEIFKKQKDKRFKYFLAPKKTSLYAARNLAISKSKGKFISFIDVDDLWTANKLKLQIPYFRDEEVGVVYSKLWVLNDKNKKKKIHISQDLPSGYIYDRIIKKYSIGIITTVIRRKIFLKLKKKFDKRYTHIGDFDLFLRLSKKCKFKAVQLPTAIYRAHGENLTTTDKIGAINEFENWLKENKINLSYANYKNIKTLIDYKKFIFFKFKSDYKSCIKLLLDLRSIKIFLKKIIILFLPLFVLKKLFWY